MVFSNESEDSWERVAVSAKQFANRGNRHIVQPLLALILFTSGVAAVPGTDAPVSPDASREVRSLLAYFSDIYGKQILSGQQTAWQGTNELGFELNYIKDASGRLPALISMDLSHYTRARTEKAGHDVVERLIDWYVNRNGVVSLCWHWEAPMNERVFYTKDTKFDPARAVTEGTPEYTATLRDIDLIAAELKLLQKAHVPVLWRPLHEANGRWFWWGAGGPEPFKKLWWMMFERLTVHHKLKNLIWVFSPGAATDLADWYPGDSYVDIIAPDHYPMDKNNGPATEMFNEMIALGGGTKLVAFGENGPIPDPDRLVTEKADWLFFITWSGRILTQNTPKEQLIKAYNHPHVLNLGHLPNLKRYPFKSAGKAVKLGFPAMPGDVAIDGARRRPVTVAVQDSEGRTVRNGTFKVTLSLTKHSDEGVLTGTLSAQTVNGIATFPELKIDKKGDNYRLAAASDRLQSGTSASFRVGPGAGVLREWWTDQNWLGLGDVDKIAKRPDGREVLCKAFETPVKTTTNFVARFRACLLPPHTGPYRFWIANESISELWLSADETPDNKVKIAEVTRNTPYSKWPHTHEAESATVNLEAGKRYYMEVLQGQDAGSTQLSVRWRLPEGVEERPIPGWRFAPINNDSSASKLAQTGTGN